MPQHTPGPWKIQGTNQIVSTGDFSPGQSWDTPIAMLWSNRAEHQDANAHLIAAAPDLLSALEDVLKSGTNINRAAIEAAIAKARGEVTT
jgi:hypothetical protein